MRRPILVLLFILYSTCALSYSCDLTSLTTLDSVKYDQCGQSIQASTKVGKTMPDWISLLGGILGIVGGMSGLYAAWRPVKLSVDHLDHMCVVYHNNGTTPAIHLPVVITNGTRKPGVITLLALSIKGDKTAEPIVCNWDQFWTEDNVGDRVFERRPSPIPVPGFASVERNVQFSVPESWKWKPDVYKICFDTTIAIGVNVDA